MYMYDGRSLLLEPVRAGEAVCTSRWFRVLVLCAHKTTIHQDVSQPDHWPPPRVSEHFVIHYGPY